jgi:hypothetical protein
VKCTPSYELKVKIVNMTTPTVPYCAVGPIDRTNEVGPPKKFCDFGVTRSSSVVPLAQWIRRVTTDHEILGSNPRRDFCHITVCYMCTTCVVRRSVVSRPMPAVVFISQTLNPALSYVIMNRIITPQS